MILDHILTLLRAKMTADNEYKFVLWAAKKQCVHVGSVRNKKLIFLRKVYDG